MPYNENQKATLKHLVSLATKAKAAIEAAVAALPKEMFLDQTQTKFIPNFTFSAETYPGATDPNLNGKAVLVFAVKGVDNAAPSDTTKQTTTYSFLDVSTLVNVYNAKAGDSAKVINIAGYEIEFKFDSSTLAVTDDGLKVKVSSTSGNALTTGANGLFVDISGKADKVANATAGHIATLDANGNIVDSGVAVTATSDGKADKVSSATNGNLAGLDGNGNLTDSGMAASNVATKVASATNGHIAGIDANGQYTDGGIAIDDIITISDIATDAEVEEALNAVFNA